MYDLYKPLRNELRKAALLRSLYVVWAWMQHLQFAIDLPGDIEVPQKVRWAQRGPPKGIYEWELAVLAKELIAVAPLEAAGSFSSWRHSSSAVNKLKDLDNNISQRYARLFREHVLIELYTTAHHQFWWQRAMRLDSEVTRYLKIFGAPALDAILRAQLGLSARALYAIGLAAADFCAELFR